MSSTASTPLQPGRTSSDRPSSRLREEVARWFPSSSRARVSRYGRIYPGGSRYVCLSAPKPGGRFALYFFHHGDDDWRLYPPSGVGPSIVYCSAEVKAPAASAAVRLKRRLRAAFES
jgi:hypothetical protein